MAEFKLGLKPDEKDDRDFLYKSVRNTSEKVIYDNVDLRGCMPSMFSQNQQSSCTGNTGVCVAEYLFNVQKDKKLTLSRQYLYNMERINDVSFVVYKSVDGSDAETVVSQVNELFRRVEKLEGTKNALWSGASAMSGDELITPTKKLSDCNNGWILVWSDFEYSTGVSSNTAFQTTVIPKQTVNLNIQGSAIYHLDIIATLNSDGTFTKGTKSLTITDSQIRGNAINIVNDNNKDICLCAIYEY